MHSWLSHGAYPVLPLPEIVACANPEPYMIDIFVSQWQWAYVSQVVCLVVGGELVRLSVVPVMAERGDSDAERYNNDIRYGVLGGQ